MVGSGSLKQDGNALPLVAARKDLKAPLTIRLFLLRHAEAEHNVAVRTRCPPEPRIAVLKEEKFFDAELSQRGWEQAQAAAALQPKELRNAVLRAEDPQRLSLFYPFCSPLRRTMQTLSAAVPELRRVEMMDLLREWAGGHYCDARMKLSETQKMFSGHFRDGIKVHGEFDDDRFPATVSRETVHEVNHRCLRFLIHLAERVAADISFLGSSLQEIVVLGVSHAGLLRQLLTVMDVFSPSDRALSNCQWKQVDIPLRPFLRWMANLSSTKTIDAKSLVDLTFPTSFPLASVDSKQLSAVGDDKKSKLGEKASSFSRVASLESLRLGSYPILPFSLLVYPPIDGDDEDEMQSLEKQLLALSECWENEAWSRARTALASDDTSCSAESLKGRDLDFQDMRVLADLAKLRNSPLAVGLLADVGEKYSLETASWFRQFAVGCWVTSGWNSIRPLRNSVGGRSLVKGFEMILKERILPNCVIIVTKWRFPSFSLDTGRYSNNDDAMVRCFDELFWLGAKAHVIEVEKLC